MNLYRSRQSPLLTVLLIEAWAVCLFMFLKYVILQQFTCPGVDFPKHYQAAVEVLHGRSPFVGSLYLGFNYPLFTAWIYLFLGTVSFDRAEFLWDLCNTLYVAASFALVIFFYRPEWRLVRTKSAQENEGAAARGESADARSFDIPASRGTGRLPEVCRDCIPLTPAPLPRGRGISKGISQGQNEIEAGNHDVFPRIGMEEKGGTSNPTPEHEIAASRGSEGGASIAPKATPSEPARAWVVRHWPSVAVFALAINAPIFLEIRDGNIEPLNLVLLIALGAALLRKRDTVAGVLLAMLCLGKILPVFFLPPLLFAGRKRAVGVCVAFLALYGLVLLATGWWRWDWFLFAQTLPNVGFHYRGLSNSLVAIAGRYLFPALFASKKAFDLTAMGIALSVVAGQVAVAILGWPLVRRSWRTGLSFASLSIVLMSPLLEYQHLIWAIPAYLFLIMDAVEERISPRFFATATSLWLAIFACRYLTDLGVWLVVSPLHASTLLLAVLWVATGTDIILRARVLGRTACPVGQDRDMCASE